MPVVINEFEVVAQPEQASQTPEALAKALPPPPTAHEAEVAFRLQTERLARVWAH